MNIYKRIQTDKDATKNMETRASLSLLQGEICKDGKQLPDADAIKILSSMIKVCNKNIVLYKEKELVDHVVQEQLSITQISKYLPVSATAKDIEAVIATLFPDDYTASMKDMGKVMGVLKQTHELVDGNLVKNILLNK